MSKQRFTPFDSPAIHTKSEMYPLEWGALVPRQVVIVHKACHLPVWLDKVRQPIALVGTIFDVWVDWNGVVSALFESGEVMGLRPQEYRVVAWHDPLVSEAV